MALELETISETGEAPERRFKDYKSVVAAYREVERADDIPAERRACVLRLVKGESPFDQAERERAGVGWQSNVNFLEAAADLEQAQTGYVTLANATPSLIEVRTKYGDPSKRAGWCDIIAKEYSWLMRRRWSSFNKNKQKTAGGFIRNGLAINYWPHDVDWRYEVGQVGQFLFPVNADVDVSKLELVFQVEHIAPSRLYRLLKDEKKVTEKGDESHINREAVIDAIRSANTAGNSNRWTFDDIVDAFEGNGLYQDYGNSKECVIVHAYVREFSDKVSHYIIRADGEGKDFLYEKFEAFASLEDFMVFYVDGVGEGKLADLQGMIQKAFPLYIKKDEIRNGMADKVMIAGSVNMRSTRGSAVGSEMMSAITFGVVNILPEGATFEAMPDFPGNGTEAFAVLSEYERVSSNNTGGYASHQVSPEGGNRTAREVSLQASNAAQISDAKYGNYYQSEAAVNVNVVNRLKNRNYTSRDPGYREMMEWRERITSQGVPLEAIFQIDEVITIQAIGYNSPQAKANAFQVLDGMRGRMDPVSQHNLDRDIAAGAGVQHDNLDRYLPDQDKIRTPQDVTIADLENGMFTQGIPFPIRPDQDHFLHAVEHDAFLNGTLKVIYDGPPPAPHGQVDAVQAVKQLSVALDHQAQHLKLITDPSKKDAVKGLQKSFDNVARLYQKIEQSAVVQQQQAALPAPQTALPPNPKTTILAQQAADKAAIAAKASQDEQARLDFEAQKRTERGAYEVTAAAHLKAAKAGVESAPTQFQPVATVIDPTVPQIPTVLPQIVTP